MSLNSVNKLIFLVITCSVLFEVRNGFLNIILTSFNFKGIIREKVLQYASVWLYAH